MKNIMTTIAMAILAVTVGCKNVPTTDDMDKIGMASGYTAAYVLNNQVKVDDNTRNAIIEIMTEVEKYIPSSNETFSVAWTPMAQKYVDKLVKEGKLTQLQAERVMKDFGYVVGLLDHYIEKKGIKEYQDLVDTFIHSFCESFLKNFKPSNGMMSNAVEIDSETYDYMNDVIQ